MKTRIFINILGSMAVGLLLGGCSATNHSRASLTAEDDLYASADSKALAAENQQRKAQRLLEQQAEEQRQQEVGRIVSDIDGQRRQTSAYTAPLTRETESENTYESRLKGVPSSYKKEVSSGTDSKRNIKTNTSGQYASAYEPAYYNVTVSGDQVTVEPKYVSSLYGDWNKTNVNINIGAWGWGYPSWGYNGWWWGGGSPGWNISWGWNWGWNDPWWGGWGPYNPWYRPYWDPWWWGPPKYNSRNTVFDTPLSNSGQVIGGGGGYRRGSSGDYRGESGVTGGAGTAGYRRGTISSGSASGRNPSGQPGVTTGVPPRGSVTGGSRPGSSESSSSPSSGYRRGTISGSSSSTPPPSSGNSFNGGSSPRGSSGSFGGGGSGFSGGGGGAGARGATGSSGGSGGGSGGSGGFRR